MIRHRTIALEPWALRETQLDLDVLAETESVFALSNGHIGLRGNLDEGDPHALPGTYLNAFYEVRPLPYPELGYGNPDAGQTVVNVTNGKLVRLLVDDEPFDVRYGELRSHERVLDLRAGVLRRTIDWVSPAGPRVHIQSTRLVSFVQRSIVAISYEVEAVDADVRVVVQSELLANEPVRKGDGDPRAAAALGAPLRSELARDRGLAALLLHSTSASGLLMAASMDHMIDGPKGTESVSESFEDQARVAVTADLKRGEHLRLVKLVAYGWSGQRLRPSIAGQARAAVLEAKHAGWDGLLAGQRAYLDDFWGRADVEIEGDTELQAAVRASMFHCLQASARAEQRAIPAKGLTGPGYDGHTFWDTEAFVLPMLTYTVPDAARDALRWRRDTLDLARGRAAELGFRGAAFPWRTIRGQECSGYWPAGTAAFHINADIAHAIVRYQHAVQDPDFERGPGLELLAETARLWRSLGHHDAGGRFRIDGVTGPDEYSAVADNNVYTNLLAQENLREAAEAAEKYMDRAGELGIDPEEAASWRDAADAMVIPYDADLRVHCQSESFTQHQRWDFDATPPDRYPLMLHYPYFDLYRKQVVKQADLVLAMHFRSDAFSDEEKLRNFDYYEALTVRDSSLSACTQAVIAAEVGHMELAFDYFGEAALIDVDDIEHNTRDGLHIASLAGAWLAAVAGFGGMRHHGTTLTFKPRLPRELMRLSFGLGFRGRQLRVEVSQKQATYTVTAGEPLDIVHYDEQISVPAEKPQKRPIPRLVAREAPRQPKGRAPIRRQRDK
ncbi:MAG TPA: glycosyl hydrolase family 65 protein [Solirubrobacteraceae bacterium]|nr:glycosyl hydrolase family 65 protein [Solirubrobacteraceae bacterium]